MTKIDFERRFIWHCEICAHVYIDSRHDELSRCPRCGSMNKKPATDALAGREVKR